MKVFWPVIAGVVLSIAVSGCFLFRATGDVVEGTGRGAASAVEGVGTGIGEAVGGAGEAVGEIGE